MLATVAVVYRVALSSAEEPWSATDAFWENGVVFKTGEGDSAETAMHLIHTGHIEEERKGAQWTSSFT